MTPAEPRRVTRMGDAAIKLGLSTSSIYNRLKEGGRWYDPNFPKPIRLGAGKRGAIGFFDDELDAWLESKR